MRNSKPSSPVMAKTGRAPVKTAGVASKHPAILKKSVASQTNRSFVFIKEENLHFSQPTKLGADGNMKRDYIKAVNYINSCHKLINSLSEKNCAHNLSLSADKGNNFALPNITNFSPLFPFLIGGGGNSNKKGVQNNRVVPREKTPNPVSPTSPHPNTGNKPTQKRRSLSASIENKKLPPIPLEPPEIKLITNKNQDQLLSSSVKNQINEYLVTLQADFTQKNPHSKSYDEVVRQKLVELSRFCSNKILTPPPVNLIRNFGDFPSVIMSDIDPDPHIATSGSTVTDFELCRNKSNTSLSTNSSDIKSDSDMELILDKV